MSKTKTRRFRLLEHLRSTSNDLRSFPNSYSVVHTYTVYDKDTNQPTIHKFAPVKNTTDISKWSEGERDGSIKLRLQKPTFVRGSILCSPRGAGALMADFLANSPFCKGSPNAEPNRVFFEEVLPEKDAEEKATYRKLKRKADAVIEQLDDSSLVGYCHIFGVKTKDIDGDFFKRVLMEDNLSTALDEIQAHENLLELVEDELTHNRLMIAQGLELGKLNHDKRNGSLSFANGGTVFQGVPNGDIIEEAAGWINSTEEGAKFLKAVEKAIGFEYEEEDDEDSFIERVASSKLSEMDSKELFEVAKERGVLVYQIGKGYFVKNNVDENEEPLIVSDTKKQAKNTAQAVREIKENDTLRNQIIDTLTA